MFRITAKIDRNFIPGETLGHSKSTRNCSRDPSGHSVASKNVSKLSREGPGTSPGRPRSARRVPKHAQGRQKERPAAPRRNQNRRQIAPRIESIEFLKRGSFANPFRHVFLTIVVNFGLNSRRFPRSLRASESNRREKSRTLIFTDRRGTSEGSRSLRTNGKSTKSVENIASRSDSCRSRNAMSKNNEHQPVSDLKTIFLREKIKVMSILKVSLKWLIFLGDQPQ